MVVRLAFVAAVSVFGAFSQVIPNRPEKLAFPSISYEPPDPSSYRVVLKSGPVAYIAPDRELPLVNVTILVRTGSYLDPQGKEGLASFVGSLLAQGGAGPNSADQLEERLAFLAANLGSVIGPESGSVTLNWLAKDIDEGFSLLRDILSAPRFETAKLDLVREQALQGMRERNDDAASIESREIGFLAYGESFAANRYPTGASVAAISTNDLRDFHRRWFCPSNFVVAASGDFNRADLVNRLERLFSAWPFLGSYPPAPPTNTAMAPPGVYFVDKDVNQGRVSILLPGLVRDDPDFPAVRVMNDILGGGDFTSRIMNRVRSDEGLAYGASSSFPGGIHYPLAFVAEFQSKSPTVAYATQITLEEMARIAASPVEAAELDTAKRSLIDNFPSTFSSRARTVNQFALDEFSGRFASQPNFWKLWRSRIAAVSSADTLRVARKYLHPDEARIVIVGQKKIILAGHPNHPVSLGKLAQGHWTDLPLRDPITMKPVASVHPTSP